MPMWIKDLGCVEEKIVNIFVNAYIIFQKNWKRNEKTYNVIISLQKKNQNSFFLNYAYLKYCLYIVVDH